MPKRQLAIALLAVAVLAGQVITAQHIHADDGPTACSICAHADSVPLVQCNLLPLPQTTTVDLYTETFADSFGIPTRFTPRVRAPPASRQHQSP